MGGFARWITSNLGTSIPQSMAPITFGLATLAHGDANGGALMMTAMTAAQVLGAVPIAAAGRRFSVSAYARVLIAFRSLAFAGLVVAIVGDAPVPALVALASLAGLVNGAIFGMLRSILNDLVEANKLPRALGITATANELVFVTGPILASTIGGLSVVAAVAIMAVTSALPLVILPRIAKRTPTPAVTHVRPKSIHLGVLVWLFAAGSAGACVAAVEIGALALALRDDLAPSAAFYFTVPLCVGSVLGGVWVTIRNRRPRRRFVVGMMLVTVTGALTVAWGGWLATTIAGAVLIGLCLAPLGTSFSLSLDDVLHPLRRAEGFALLQTSKSIGVIVASSILAFASLEAALLTTASLTVIAAIVLAVHGKARRADLQAAQSSEEAIGR